MLGCRRVTSPGVGTTCADDSGIGEEGGGGQGRMEGIMVIDEGFYSA